MVKEIRELLFASQDETYRRFQGKLMPGVPLSEIIGVRTPILRKLARELYKNPSIDEFLSDLPHAYYDEYNLHGFIISECRDYEKAVAYVDALLPYVNNWATCDLLSPKAFKKNRALLKKDIERWLSSDLTFTVRFGIEMIQSHFLDEDFDPAFLPRVASITSDEYYVNMMIAWFFATALAKRWEESIPFIEERRLSPWVHAKTIRKAVESFRITPEQKDYLRSLKGAI